MGLVKREDNLVRIDLGGQHAIITGGSRGIGAATAVLLAGAGARITIAYRSDHAAAGRVIERVQSCGSQAVALSGDLSDVDAVDTLIKSAQRKMGKIDILICNAGIWERAPIDQMTPRQWRRTLDTNLTSVYAACRAVAPAMIQRNQGNLILVSSTAGQRGEANYSHYAASKGAIIAFTKSLAAELGPNGIRVNCVAPGWVRTDMTAEVFSQPEAEATILASTPVRRLAMPEDIAGPILFLASSLSTHVHGEVLNVNGGSVLCG